MDMQEMEPIRVLDSSLSARKNRKVSVRISYKISTC